MRTWPASKRRISWFLSNSRIEDMAAKVMGSDATVNLETEIRVAGDLRKHARGRAISLGPRLQLEGLVGVFRDWRNGTWIFGDEVFEMGYGRFGLGIAAVESGVWQVVPTNRSPHRGLR
jgi:hypothetical protein